MDTVHGFKPRRCQMLLQMLAGLRKSLWITEVSTFFFLFKYFVSLFLLSISLLASIAGIQFSDRVGTGLLHIWNWTSVVSIIEKLESSKIKIKWMLDLQTSLSCYLFSLCIRSKNAFCHNNNSNNSLHYYPGISHYWIPIKVLYFLTLSQS